MCSSNLIHFHTFGGRKFEKQTAEIVEPGHTMESNKLNAFFMKSTGRDIDGIEARAGHDAKINVAAHFACFVTTRSVSAELSGASPVGIRRSVILRKMKKTKLIAAKSTARSTHESAWRNPMIPC